MPLCFVCYRVVRLGGHPGVPDHPACDEFLLVKRFDNAVYRLQREWGLEVLTLVVHQVADRIGIDGAISDDASI